MSDANKLVYKNEMLKPVNTSDEIFRSYFDLGQTGMCISSLEQKWLHVNSRLCEMLGYTQGELVNMTWTELTDPKDLELNLGQFQQLVSGEIERYSMDKRFIHKSGTVVYTHLTVTCKRKSDNSVEYIIASVLDISDRIKAETALSASEARFRLLYETSMDGILLTSPEGSIFAANPAACKIFQRTEEEMRQIGRGGIVDITDSRLENALEVRSSMGSFIGELTCVRKDGTKFPGELSTSQYYESDGNLRSSIIIRDISARKQLEEQIKQLAYYDTLTKLPNRSLFEDRIKLSMAVSKRTGKYCALIFLDLDNFKPLNDLWGHGLGDLLLIEAADRIKYSVRESDTVARYGGDEFVVILNELHSDKVISTNLAFIVAEKIRLKLVEPFRLDYKVEGKADIKVEHQCTASIGMTFFMGHEVNLESLLNSADSAMFRSKDAGRNSIRISAD